MTWPPPPANSRNYVLDRLRQRRSKTLPRQPKAKFPGPSNGEVVVERCWPPLSYAVNSGAKRGKRRLCLPLETLRQRSNPFREAGLEAGCLLARKDGVLHGLAHA